MNKIRIGTSDLELQKRINLGGNVFGWTLDENKSTEILNEFISRGGNFIDTADVYSSWANGNKGGESEIIIGNWLKKRKDRNNIIIATKVGYDFGDGRKGLRPDYIKKSAEDSLRRLQIETIDLYYTHLDDLEIPVEDILGTYADLIKEGKIRYIAASNISPERLRKSIELGLEGSYPLYQALQPHYNLMERKGYESEYASLVEEFGLTVFPYYSLASGFLTGKYRTEKDFDQGARGAGVKKYFNDKGKSILNALDQIALKHQTSPAVIALGWLLSKPGIGAPIASATNNRQLATLFEAVNIILDKEDIQILDDISK